MIVPPRASIRSQQASFSDSSRRFIQANKTVFCGSIAAPAFALAVATSAKTFRSGLTRRCVSSLLDVQDRAAEVGFAPRFNHERLHAHFTCLRAGEEQASFPPRQSASTDKELDVSIFA